MTTRAALGIDLGTSGVKTTLLDDTGHAHATATRTYPVVSPRPGWAETDPARWEQAAREAVAEVVAAAPGVDVAAVGIAGQMHGTVLVDAAGEPVRPAVLWPDSRAADQLPRWLGLASSLRAALANPLTPGMSGPVLGWLTEHEPDTVARARAFVLPKDWLRSRLVPSAAITDGSDASASLLWDAEHDAWAIEVAETVGVPTRLLPAVRPSDEAVGALTPAVAQSWGLPPHVPVSVGCSDVAATLLGLSAGSGRTVLTVGTGAQLVLPGVEPVTGGPITHHLYRDAVGGWFAQAAILNAGLALTRVIELLGADWDSLYRAYDVEASLPGFLPYFAGERLPAGITAGVAGWFDIGLATTRADLLAAAIEGVAFTVRRALDAMPPADETVDLVGGGSRSAAFSQLLADVLHRPLRQLAQRDATVLGAATLGWLAAGEKPPLKVGGGELVLQPRPSTRLDERYERFLRHTTALEEAGR